MTGGQKFFLLLPKLCVEMSIPRTFPGPKYNKQIRIFTFPDAPPTQCP